MGLKACRRLDIEFNEQLFASGDPILKAPPKQTRAEATRHKIVAAAAAILSREGAGALNTNRIAREAGISIGGLYRHFGDKSDICAQIAADRHRALVKHLAALPASDEVSEDTCAMMKTVLSREMEDAALASALAEALKGSPAEATLRKAGRETLSIVVERLAEAHVIDPERVGQELIGITRGLARAALLADPEATPEVVGARLAPLIETYLAENA